MKNKLLIITILVLLACHADRKEIPEINRNKTKKLSDSSLIKKNCDCLSFDKRPFYSTSLRFQNAEHVGEVKARNDAQWRTYSHDSVRLKVKSIDLRGYDTIPTKFRIFENVERVFIESDNGIKGLDNFPKLKEVEFFFSAIKIDSTDNWLKTIEVLEIGKTKVQGLNSFKSLPSLVELHMGFSGFDQFPSDIESLTCLKKLNLGAYMFGQIDLKRIDLTKFKCLKEATFSTWYETLTGIPKGLQDTTVNIILEVRHEQLTRVEKNKLNAYNKRVKRVSP